ncbi:kinase-like domain-containing protein [Lyophyllum atratum]|nr:kinase-like domain-containing protein [Lyophyllum atratum]
MEWTVKQAAAQDHTRPTSLGDIVTTSSPNDSIIARLESIFQEIDQYKALLARRGEEAQTLLNTFQALLDEDAVEAPFRRSLVVAMRRLSKNANLYPQGFEIASIESYGDDPVAGGGYADIYKGRLQGETVCLKTIRIYEPHQVDHLIKKYSREAILWRQLSHPNLLPFFGFTRLRSRLAFVSPWAGNGHVINFLEENPNVDRILLCLDTAAGVSYLHENNVIHGDLKATNVLVDGSGRAALADFGLSAVTDSQILHWTSHSPAASRGGTARWQAPELHEGDGESVSHNTPASDIYAWGCVCYEIFTGRIPFYKWNRDGAVISQIKLGTRPSQPSRSELAWTEWGLTDRIWDLIIECWKHHPDERPDISTIIERLVQDRQVDPRPPGQWTGSTTRFRRRSYQQPDQEAVKSLLSRVLPSNLELVACECAFASPSSNVRNSNVARRSTIAQATKVDKTNTVTPSRLVQELLPTCTSNVEDFSSLAPRSGGFVRFLELYTLATTELTQIFSTGGGASQCSRQPILTPFLQVIPYTW